ncbi:MAG: PhzF family phenazine biosynthesis protein [Candidatus Eisenbacteria bacterium]|uniref:PhzF family phenazine biosynthesis protein n=1 Tax=Eiseniibacteriota bacterium TaxID=2212470 RepID=A0A948W4W2_UNCEI|nr:PhzF family phenazine biosynthesis protein [Candidatus Eisenbacteria bacterium]MBU1948679.1 PhzF family phenazine biosynthesis protein [Candidatus Eisenbacteria bacterium]MBU2692662.1 PhzF family phenazine biosynthesis protein [Candidatus Eisenbacteria bacterium]
MNLPIYQIDAFTESCFGGNPAGVVLLDEEMPDYIQQAIAAENNLSETAFVLPNGSNYKLRWFTPTMEIDLCGHATLASAFVLYNEGRAASDKICFETQSGLLTVTKSGDYLYLNFPARPAKPASVEPDLVKALGAKPSEVHLARDLMAVFDSASEIVEMEPDFQAIAALEAFSVIVTAPGDDVDFVSRFFVPKGGINEDPVTGSAHCTLIPYWAKRLNKNELTARQVSARGGDLLCKLEGDRVIIGGQAVEYMRGEIVC